MPPIKKWIFNTLQILVIISLAISFLQNPNQKNLEELQASTLKVFPNNSETLENNLQAATILKIIDGDTIKVFFNNKEETIRLIGIDTPETHRPNTPIQCYGPEATQALTQKIQNQTIYLETDPSQDLRDKYNRLLAYVFLSNTTSNTSPENINLWMIQEGYAHEYTYSKPYKYQSEFQTAELFAQQELKGLWEECQFSE